MHATYHKNHPSLTGGSEPAGHAPTWLVPVTTRACRPGSRPVAASRSAEDAVVRGPTFLLSEGTTEIVSDQRNAAGHLEVATRESLFPTGNSALPRKELDTAALMV